MFLLSGERDVGNAESRNTLTKVTNKASLKARELFGSYPYHTPTIQVWGVDVLYLEHK